LLGRYTLGSTNAFRKFVRAPDLLPPFGRETILAVFGDVALYIRADGTLDPRRESLNMISAELSFLVPLVWGNPLQRATILCCLKPMAPTIAQCCAVLCAATATATNTGRSARPVNPPRTAGASPPT
jgi:hypothetical protein